MSSVLSAEAGDAVDSPPAGGAVYEVDGGCTSRAKRREVDELHDEDMENEDMYNMHHSSRGYAMLINQERFSIDLKISQGLGKRDGTRVDQDHLENRLRALGFTVLVYRDQTADQIVKACTRMAKKDHTDCDCFVCIVLSHGEEGIIFGYDKALEISELAKPFTKKNCPTLDGKPKLFFLQACRGHQTDPGVKVSVYDGQDVPDSIPGPEEIALPAFEPDFLFAHSTVPGYFSWRNAGKGSWFVQALTAVLKLHGDKYEIQKLLTIVIRKVAQDFQSQNQDNPGMKQASCFRSMLTKDLYFRKKPKSSKLPLC